MEEVLGLLGGLMLLGLIHFYFGQGAPMTTVNVIGVLRRNHVGAWVLESIRLFSEPAWSITIGGDRDFIFVQLMPAICGKDYQEATELAKAEAQKYLAEKGLDQLVTWARA